MNMDDISAFGIFGNGGSPSIVFSEWSRTVNGVVQSSHQAQAHLDEVASGVEKK